MSRPTVSIIVCSRTASLNDSLKQNIHKTIGVPYELIVIDNSRNEHTMFTAYNQGIQQAHGELLCFMHEDVWFHSQDWGKCCANHFNNDPQLGIIGLAGGMVMEKGMDWRAIPINSDNYIQRFKTLERQSRSCTLHVNRNRPPKGLLQEVVCVDGMWMVIRAKLFPPLSFDEETFKGFHLYDTDICLQAISQGYRVCVCHDILMEHFSCGSFSQEYYEELARALKKWDTLLPLCKGMDRNQEQIDQAVARIKGTRSDLHEQQRLQQELLAWRNKESERENAIPMPQELFLYVQDSILLYHHIYNKSAPGFQDAVREIRRSSDEGWLTPAQKRMFIWKAFLYQYILTGQRFKILTR